MSFDAGNPTSLAPTLNQVFYIGDGHAGYSNLANGQLSFTAPTGATRLYLGAIDAWSFNGLTGRYNDNQGAFSVDVALAVAPEPASWALIVLGFGSMGMLMRRRRPASVAA